MRKVFRTAALLALALLFACAAVAEGTAPTENAAAVEVAATDSAAAPEGAAPAEGPTATESPYAPGLARAARAAGIEQAQVLANAFGVGLTDGAPLYAPANPQPLNAFIVTHPDCKVGIEYDGMYKVSEKGLVSQITDLLVEWMSEIDAASGYVIQFVADPNDADILICAKQSYAYYGTYTGEDLIAYGHSSVIALTAWQLSNPANTVTLSARQDPDTSVNLNSGGDFWMMPPELEGTEQLQAFVDTMLGWYGCGAQRGVKGDGVKAVQQSLIDRGFLNGKADGDFGPKSEAAVKALQTAYGLEPTGVVDGKTLVAAYYDQDAVNAIP